MEYRAVYAEKAVKDLGTLDQTIARRIVKTIGRFLSSPNPLVSAKPLSGSLSGYFRFRIGDYRAIFRKEKNGKIIILFIPTIKHRREVYD